MVAPLLRPTVEAKIRETNSPCRDGHTANKPNNMRITRWNFGDSRGTSLSLDEFLAQKDAAGVEFFAGNEPWLAGINKLSGINRFWALRDPVVKEAITKALANRFPSR